jgi:hypothetical protein
MEPCDHCAFRKGCETWHELGNRGLSQISAAGPLIFVCHEGLRWTDPLADVLPLKSLIPEGGRMRICEGWKRAVRERAWPKDPDLRRYQRWLAHQSLETFRKFQRGEATVRALQRALFPLDRFYKGPRAWQLARMKERNL